jgi:aryl-alcohol dehydrogenase-like predicted oxidoreductase
LKVSPIAYGTWQLGAQEGKIRHVGVSNYDAAQMAEFARTRPVETLLPPIEMVRDSLS